MLLRSGESVTSLIVVVTVSVYLCLFERVVDYMYCYWCENGCFGSYMFCSTVPCYSYYDLALLLISDYCQNTCVLLILVLLCPRVQHDMLIILGIVRNCCVSDRHCVLMT